MKNKLTLAKRIAQRMSAGARVIIVQEADEALARHEVLEAAATCAPVVERSCNAMDASELVQRHSAKGAKGTLVTYDYIAAFGTNEGNVRDLRMIALSDRDDAPTLIMIERPATKIPDGILGDAEVIVSALPDVAALRAELDSFIFDNRVKLDVQCVACSDERSSGVRTSRTHTGECDALRNELATAVTGLPRHSAARLYGRCLVEERKLDASWLRSSKATLVTQRLNGSLTFANTEGADVGGCDLLMADLAMRRDAFFSAKARAFGCVAPKGALLVGPPGTGKTAIAKSVARAWKLPLLCANLDRVLGSHVGDSEHNLNSLIEAAEASAPCVMLIDEINQMVGDGSQGGDSGVQARLTGRLLSWLNDKTSAVYVLGTCNDATKMHVALTRSGRFDGVWYVGLPRRSERRDIYRIHLSRRGRTLLDADLDVLADATSGFGGAEIEQTVIDALFICWNDGARELRAADVLATIKATIPVSASRPEVVEAIVAWGKRNAKPASSVAEDSTLIAQDGAATTVRRPRIGG